MQMLIIEVGLVGYTDRNIRQKTEVHRVHLQWSGCVAKSVCLSVCLTCLGIVAKRLHISSKMFEMSFVAKI